MQHAVDDSRPGEPRQNLLSPIGYQNSSCGYCRSDKGSYCYYVQAEFLTPKFYELLITRGWRRSGSLLYKPNPRVSCCPHHTIRLEAAAFKPSKDQRQTVNRFNRYILGNECITSAARLHPKSRQDARRYKQDFDLVERVHESELKSVKRGLSPAHDLVITLEDDTFTEEKYLLFEQYQRLVHHDPPHRISRDGFKNFICDSPLFRTSTSTSSSSPQQLGSYHQCYRLDGRLIALSVLDLLPSAISAVYFIYAPSLSPHSLGKLSAIREAALARESGRKWYMMGFYIESCAKMRYKRDFRPQYALDVESGRWAELGGGLGGDKTGEAANPGGKEDENTTSRTSTSASAASSSLSSPDLSLPLTSQSMPGILPLAQLPPAILDNVRLRIGDEDARTRDLVGWESCAIDDARSVKSVVADLVAAVGLEAAEDMVVFFP